ncbi:MAG: M28 family peptidase [Mariniblastus sp.]|nr:M28 family peptidase [Mariniblastus sp.]
MPTARRCKFVSASICLLLLFANNIHSQELLPTKAQQRVAKKFITEDSLRGDIRFLADDLLEGRGPGTRGDQLAQAYITSQFQMIGLEPAAADGAWVQPVPLVGVTTQPPKTLAFKVGENLVEFNNFDDYIVTSGQANSESKIEDAEVLFVGYGMQAPEYDWDDFKDVDVKGKVLIIMNNDPADDPNKFAGRTRLYYGRWDYKYAKAAEMGAVGALIIHTTPSAGYPYQVVQTSWTGEQMALGGPQSGRLPMEGWLTNEAGTQLMKAAGKDLEGLKKAAESKDFRPISLGATLSVSMKCRVRERTSGNVLGLLRGSDPELSKQWIVYTAHHDHIGMAEKRDEKTDNIYNGAVDNASGVGSMLAIARAMSNLPKSERPKRSILFASVAAEEQGLLGSDYLAQNPPIPAGRLAAVINIDGINILGKTKDIAVIGRGKSDMDRIVERMAKWQNRLVVGDQFPDRGYYYRSDQFSLAKVGVPGVYLGSGVFVIGKPEGWGKQKMREWTENIYHQTSDEYSDDWNLDGAIDDARLMFFTGVQAANQPSLPAWNAGDEFEAARLRALQQVK